MMRNAKKWIRRLFLAGLLIMAGLWLIQEFVVPPMLRAQIVKALEKQGLTPAKVTVSQTTLFSVTLTDLQAGEAISARIVHLRYNPLALITGQLRQIVVDGLIVRPASFPTPPSPASANASAPLRLPEVKTLHITNSSIELPSPAGPVTVPVRIDANAQDHKLTIRVQASLNGTTALFDAITDPQFTDMEIHAQIDADLGRLAAELAPKIQTKGTLSLNAAGNLNRKSNLTWKLSNVDVRSTIDELFVRASGVKLHGIKLAAGFGASGDGRTTVIQMRPDASATVGQIDLPGKRPAVPLVINHKAATFTQTPNGWELEGDGGMITLGDLDIPISPGRFAFMDRKPTGQMSSTISLAKLTQSKLLLKILPVLAKMQLDGNATVRLIGAESGGRQQPSLQIVMDNGKITSQEYQLTADGIAGQITLIDFANPHSLPSQQLTLHYGQMGKFEVRDGLFQFALKDLSNISVEKSQLGWAGGQLWCDPYTVNFADPVIRTKAYGRGLDLGKIVWIASSEKAWATGLVDIDLPVTFLWPKVRFGNGFVETRPGSVLHLQYVADQLTKYLNASDPRFVTDPTYAAIGKRMADALNDFRVDKLRADFKRGDNKLETALQLQGAGAVKDAQALNLNVSVSDLDWLISRYLSVKR